MAPSIGLNLRVTGHCNQGGRKYMEDVFSVAYQQTDDEMDLEYAFFGIFDGHGGKEAAVFAKVRTILIIYVAFLIPNLEPQQLMYAPGALDGQHCEAPELLVRKRRPGAEGDSRRVLEDAERHVGRLAKLGQDQQWTPLNCWHHCQHSIH